MRRILLVALVATAPIMATAQEQEPTRILVYGDSLTWGWVPSEPLVPTTRHAVEDRWTTALADALGDGYEIVVEGLSGRTTNVEDPNDPKLNGADYLPAALASHEPLDLVIIMLGTNDTKTYLDRTPFEIALGMGKLITIVQEAPGWDWSDYPTPEVLVVAPPPLAEQTHAGGIFEGARAKTMALPALYAEIAATAGEHAFDAGSVVETEGVDGIHFTAATNAELGAAVAAEVQRVLAP